MGVTNSKQRTQERKQWKEIIEQAKTLKELRSWKKNRHISIKLVLYSHMVSLFHHTSPSTHRCLKSSPIAHWNGSVFRCSVQTVCCYWILNRGKSSSNWNSEMNTSRLWWSVCWCEYSKTMGKAVQRWRTGASRYEWQNMKWKACDCKW